MIQSSRSYSGKENIPRHVRQSRQYPPVKSQIEFYNERASKASQIPRLIKPTTEHRPVPHSPTSSDALSVEGSEFEVNPDQFQSRSHSRISVVPTASSVYTDSPEFPPGFDPVAAQVAPLFANRSSARSVDSEGSNSPSPQQRQSLAVPPRRKPLPQSAPLRLAMPDRAAKAGITGLGLDTSERQLQPWQGNTGTTNLMTPIADASVASADSHSVSPLSSHDIYGSIYAKYAGNDPTQSYSPGPTISDIDDRDFRSALAGPEDAPSALEKVQQSFGNLEHGESDQTLRGTNYIYSSTPNPQTTPTQNDHEWSPQSYAKRKIGQQQSDSRFSWTTKATEQPRDLTPTRTSFEASVQATPPRHGPAVRQPLVSRFSWTTRDTRPPGATQSPPTSPPRLDLPPEVPIMARGHPISSSAQSSAQSSPKALNVRRKPTPSLMSGASGVSDRTGSDKELPLSPPELDSIDIITALKAQLEDCAYRKANLQKLIHAHTALQPQNPLTQDLAKRRANREKVEQFENELAEVLNKEHELGLRLHRAWKRRDQEAPTAIWVRRICS